MLDLVQKDIKEIQVQNRVENNIFKSLKKPSANEDLG